MHENCTPEYTLATMLAGTYNLVVVPDLQGDTVADPKALPPMEMRLLGSMMLDRLLHR